MAHRNIPFDRSFASHPKSKYWSNENEVSPREVALGSGKKYKFDCPTCHHTYVSRVAHVVNGSECGYCTNKYLCNDICDICYKKSFHSHSKSKYWSDENEISPREVFKRCKKKFLFVCNVCDHTFNMSPLNVTKGSFCPYCANRCLCTNDDCNTCHKKSFASHIMAQFWSDENEVSPRSVFKSARAKYKFDCATCDHTSERRLHSITQDNQSCPYCWNHKLCLDDDCDTCYNKSFKSHPQSEYWSSENGVSPRQVTKFSHKKYKFVCPYCNQIYETTPCSVSRGKWCPCIKNKTEIILYKYLQSILDCQVVNQKRFKWCKNILCLPFDFCIKDFKIIIELDGRQHFVQTSNWEDPTERQENDIYKMKCANQHGYSVIRIFQEDVWNNKNNWKTKLYNAIENYTKPTNILIGKIYDEYPIYQDV
jgi:very-short-patch-repair endonuclease